MGNKTLLSTRLMRSNMTWLLTHTCPMSERTTNPAVRAAKLAWRARAGLPFRVRCETGSNRGCGAASGSRQAPCCRSHSTLGPARAVTVLALADEISRVGLPAAVAVDGPLLVPGLTPS